MTNERCRGQRRPLNTQVDRNRHRLVSILALFPAPDRAGRPVMKPYILGAIAVWFLMGFTGAILLGQQRIDAPTIVSGPVALWEGINSERLINQ